MYIDYIILVDYIIILKLFKIQSLFFVFCLLIRFKDKAVYGYGTSIPPNNNEADENEASPKKVIFCVHGKLSGCCTVVKGATSIDETANTTINISAATAIDGIDFQQTSSGKNRYDNRKY